VAIRLKVDRGLVTDIPVSDRTSREVLTYAANSYFDALEDDDGKIAAFADDCARHENGYQTVNNPPPGGRLMPAPPLPNPDTPQGKDQLKMSMFTCAPQIDSRIFAFEAYPAQARACYRPAKRRGDDVRALRPRWNAPRR
jgi:hypothetical protein